jgi:hypothetical protein
MLDIIFRSSLDQRLHPIILNTIISIRPILPEKLMELCLNVTWTTRRLLRVAHRDFHCLTLDTQDGLLRGIIEIKYFNGLFIYLFI